MYMAQMRPLTSLLETTPSYIEIFIEFCTSDLLLHFMSFWDIPSIFSMQKTCRKIRCACEIYIASTWSLSPFFDNWFNTKELQQILHKCNAIISGSQALQFFSRERYPDCDTDFFVRLGGAKELISWLLCQGYIESEQNTDYDDGNIFDDVMELSAKCIEDRSSCHHAVLGVYNFFRNKQAADGGTAKIYQVQVVVVDTDPIEHVLFDFHSSKFLSFLVM